MTDFSLLLVGEIGDRNIATITEVPDYFAGSLAGDAEFAVRWPRSLIRSHPEAQPKHLPVGKSALPKSASAIVASSRS